MSALHVRRRHGLRTVALLLGLAVLVAIPLGCGGQPETTGAATTNPKSAERKRDMENFMKNQKAQ
jgi:hypothetical protein